MQLALQGCRQGLPPDHLLGPLPAGRARVHQHPPESFSDSSWSELDQAGAGFDTRFRVLQSCPHHLRGRFHQAARCALEVRHEAVSAGDPTTKNRAWTWFCLLLFMLFLKQIGQGRVGKRELRRRFDVFNEGKWKQLVEEGLWKSHSSPRRGAQSGKESPCYPAEGSIGRSVASPTMLDWSLHLGQKPRSQRCRTSVLSW